MKALVTGATGFLGSHITRQLRQAGYAVRVLYRSESKLRQFVDLELETARATLDDPAALERACAGCELVFHAAAKADYWKDDDREALWRVNVEGTRNLLEAAQMTSVRRVIFTSSASTIGIRPGEEQSDESDSFNLSPERFYYGWSKHEAEKVAARFVADGLDVVTLNPTVIIGPGDMNAISGSFVIETARWQWLLPMSRGGVALIDARDAAAAHIAAINRGQCGERYILNAANLSYRQFFPLIAAACGVRAPIFTTPDWMLEPTARLIELLRALGVQTPMDANQARLGGSHVYLDGSKAERELHAPRIDIETSLRDAFGWYQRRGYIQRGKLSRLIGLI